MRKTILLSLLGLLFFFLFNACDRNNQELKMIEEKPLFDDLEIIKRLGFNISSAIDMGEYYLVEEDISIPKENIEGYKKKMFEDGDSITTRQAYSNAVVSISNASNIKVKIDASLMFYTSNWRNAILEAMEHYNSVASEIYMYEVSSNPDITILSSPVNAWGQGEFPTGDGKPGRTIRINSSAAYNLSLQQKIFLIAHEMGHNLGFRHTDYLTAYYPYSAEGESVYGANHISGTPTGTVSSQDPNSVFNSGYYYGGEVIPWAGFSNYDKHAIRYLYPAQMAIHSNIVGNKISSQGDKATYYLSNTTSLGFSYHEITWTLTLNGNIVSTYTDSRFQHIFNEPGIYMLKCFAKFSKGSGILTFEKEIEINVYPKISSDQWYVFNAQMDGDRYIKYDLVYKATQPYQVGRIHVLMLYNGTYDLSIYNGDFDWKYDSDYGYVVPTLDYSYHGSYEWFSGVSIEAEQVGVIKAFRHPIYPGYNLSNIEVVNIYETLGTGFGGERRRYSLLWFWDQEYGRIP